MDLGLKGRVAVVMAASEGIGFGCAQALAEEGARVAICGRRKEALDAARRRLQEGTGAEVWTRTTDVSRPGESAAFIDEAVAHFGTRRLDALVNNGGGPKPGMTLAFDDQAWHDAFQLLVLSNLRACRAAYPHMRTAGGSIVNIVSTSVKQPIENLVLSSSLRSAVVGLAKTLSIEWGGERIRVNNVCPGSINTVRIEEVVQSVAKREGIPVAQARAQRERAIPLGRFGEPLEIGRAVAFLASHQASYITGETLSVDGGATRWIHG